MFSIEGDKDGLGDGAAKGPGPGLPDDGLGDGRGHGPPMDDGQGRGKGDAGPPYDGGPAADDGMRAPQGDENWPIMTDSGLGKYPAFDDGLGKGRPVADDDGLGQRPASGNPLNWLKRTILI